EGLRSFQVDDQLEFDWELDGKIAWLLAFEDSIHISRGAASSTFRSSTTPVSMSLAGSRFSSDSAPRPFHGGPTRKHTAQPRVTTGNCAAFAGEGAYLSPVVSVKPCLLELSGISLVSL